MVNGTLYAAPKSCRTNRILIAALYGDSQIKVEYPSHDLDTSKFPLETLPSFETSDGTFLYDINSIALFVSKFVSKSNHKQFAEIFQWMNLADNNFLPPILSWVLPSLSALPYYKNKIEEAKKELIRLLNFLNNYLVSRTYLVGEHISLADIALSCNLLLAYEHVLEPKLREPFDNVNQWFERCVHQPNFLSVLGEVNLCIKSTQFDAPKFIRFQEHRVRLHSDVITSITAPAANSYQVSWFRRFINFFTCGYEVAGHHPPSTSDTLKVAKRFFAKAVLSRKYKITAEK